MHVSSLGEFEQGRSVLERIKATYPDAYAVLTFFSPSGFSRVAGKDHADAVYYLPWDTKKNVSHFLDHIRPDIVIWVKYDFWFGYWKAMAERKIPVILIAARMTSDYWLLRKYAKPLRHTLFYAEAIFTQDEETTQSLKNAGYESGVTVGDPRVDRVINLPDLPLEDPILLKWSGDKPVLIIGSAWKEDLDVISSSVNELLANWRVIIAPHECSEAILKNCEQSFGANCQRWSLMSVDDRNPEVIILDTIGLLNRVYRLGAVAYVGGGFGKGIHNLLEAAVYGIPVLFGPRHDRFPEAKGLIAYSGGFCVNGPALWSRRMTELSDIGNRQKAGQQARLYITDHAGSTGIIMENLKKKWTREDRGL